MLKYSLGELVDKLAVVHLKIWHLEEQIKETSDESTVEDLCDQVINLNTTRNEIIKSIDEYTNE